MLVSAPELASVGPSKVKDQRFKVVRLLAAVHVYIFRLYKRIASLGVTRQGKKQPEAMGKTFRVESCGHWLVAVIRFPAAIPSSFPRESLHVIAKSRKSPF